MLKFANQLTSEEVGRFISSNGFLVHEVTLAQTARDTVNGTFNIASYNFEFLFDDNVFVLKAILYNSAVIKQFEEHEADISSEDWHCFMRERFGDEYVRAYFDEYKQPYITEVSGDMFLSRITIEDVFSLLGNRLTSISCIKEVTAFASNKRRFKFYTGTDTREVTISSFYDDSSIKKYISEENFVRFMFEKFGKDYAKYYLEVIETIEKYIKNSEAEFEEKSNIICVYKENEESLKCKKYLAEKIFGKK